MKHVVFVFLALFITGCETVGTVRLKHPQTGLIAKCPGGTGLYGVQIGQVIYLQRTCIQDFTAQGYRRASE